MHGIGSVRAVKSGGGSLLESEAIPRSDREKLYSPSILYREKIPVHPPSLHVHPSGEPEYFQCALLSFTPNFDV